MKKTIFLFSLTALLVLTGCSNNTVEKVPKSVDNNNSSIATVKEETEDITASASVDYIDFEATLITVDNFDELNTEFDNGLSKTDLETSTQIVLTMNNHREDLAAFDYKELSTLDGLEALGWQQFSQRMGGHHVGGVLTFAKNENPRVLLISGLPVGEAVLNF